MHGHVVDYRINGERIRLALGCHMHSQAAVKTTENRRTLLADSRADGLLSSSLRCLDGPSRGLDVDVDVVLLDDLRVLDACISPVIVPELDAALVVEGAIIVGCTATPT